MYSLCKCHIVTHWEGRVTFGYQVMFSYPSRKNSGTTRGPVCFCHADECSEEDFLYFLPRHL